MKSWKEVFEWERQLKMIIIEKMYLLALRIMFVAMIAYDEDGFDLLFSDG